MNAVRGESGDCLGHRSRRLARRGGGGRGLGRTARVDVDGGLYRGDNMMSDRNDQAGGQGATLMPATSLTEEKA